jgi:hypothetical protein
VRKQNGGVPGGSLSGRAVYQFRIEGRLEGLTFAAADELTLTVERAPTGQAVTTLTATLADQGALLALIKLLHDRGLSLIAIQRLDPLP